MSLVLNILAGAFREAGEAAVVGLLQKLHDTDPKQYKLALLGGKLLTDGLDPLVDKTKTKVDDALVDGIASAVKTSAEQNNIDLSVFDEFLAEASAKLA